MTPSLADPLVGTLFDNRYRIVSKIGEGETSTVFSAEHSSDARAVAVKVLRKELGLDAELHKRFEEEAMRLANLTHPHVVQVLDFGIASSRPYLVMELLEGITLDVYIEKILPDSELALDIATQILSGIAFAHSRGIVHGDIKTENVFITNEGEAHTHAKVLDFGWGKFFFEDRTANAPISSRQSEALRAAAYVSPEQAVGAPVDMRSDTYCAGIVLFELLTGVWPFLEETRLEMLRAHLSMPSPPLSAARPDLQFDREIDALIKKALMKKPEDRFQSADEMHQALQRLPKAVARPRTIPPIPPKRMPEDLMPPRQRPFSIWTLLIVGALMLALYKWAPWLLRHSQ